MTTDVRLDEVDGNYLILAAPVVKVEGSDFMLESGERRAGHGGAFRRALVHDQADGLTVNFNGDYPGGVTLQHVAEIIPKEQGTFISNLVIRGGISFEMEDDSPGVLPGGISKIPVTIPKRVTISLGEQLAKLQAQITDLNNKIAVLQNQLKATHP